ncbi:hypothetical protein ACRALDRAFT_2017788 [Sodiomyces alcalophilus JCM 7366]|uniref:uncharacterized protein n=1 Tax=Sodiomyces alcalophilus JCM 7366 TaxID=591952 RepID=UPI0039B66FD3
MHLIFNRRSVGRPWTGSVVDQARGPELRDASGASSGEWAVGREFNCLYFVHYLGMDTTPMDNSLLVVYVRCTYEVRCLGKLAT